jgi:hydrophobe/amphiphile efflux-3 (HAE3) family protein
VKAFLGRVSEWAVAHPGQTIASVISIVSIVGVIGVLRLTPDAGTDKLVDHGSSAYAGTQEFRERFGDDAIVVLARADLRQLVKGDQLGQLLKLESCLSGNAPTPAELPEGEEPFPTVCEQIRGLGVTRVVFGPATFLNQSATQAAAFIQQEFAATLAEVERVGTAASERADKRGLGPAQQREAAAAAQQAVIAGAIAEFQDLAVRVSEFGPPGIDNPRFVSAVVFDSRLPAGTPKSRFGYLFPSEDGALVSIRLEPNLDDDTRRQAIGLIREAAADPAFELEGGGYEISGVPVLVEGLANELGTEIFVLLGVALVVMAITLIMAFGPPLTLLPLFVALGASAMAFGLLSIIGGSLTMASVAVLPVVIGLGVDYAIQLQARFREAVAAGTRPAAAAVTAAVSSGPVIAAAAVATTVGFLSLLFSPIPMVREFAFALVVGIVSAFAIALTAGLAALSTIDSGAGGERRRSDPELPTGAIPLGGGAFGRRFRRFSEPTRGWASGLGGSALATAISRPGRVLAIAAVLAAGGWVASTQTEVVSDIEELVPSDLPALQSVNALESATGVSSELDVIVRGADVTTPEAVGWMRDFKQRVLEQQGFAGKFPDCRADGTELCPGPALSDLIRIDGEPSQARIDGVLEVVPDYFLQAILSAPEEGDQLASISFLLPVMPLDDQEALISEIRDELDPPPGLSAEVVGLPVLAADANAELSGSRYWLTLVGLVAVALVLLAIYRSPRRALVPLIPIALATGWSALVLAAVQIPLNPMSATLGVLVIAVATEFSVILSARYHEERSAGRSVGQALRQTYARTGTAVLASGVTSIAGFGVLSVSGIKMLRDFGLVTIVDLSVALLGVMFVLPATLVWAESGFRPFPAPRRRPGGSKLTDPTEPAA